MRCLKCPAPLKRACRLHISCRNFGVQQFLKVQITKEVEINKVQSLPFFSRQSSEQLNVDCKYLVYVTIGAKTRL